MFNHEKITNIEIDIIDVCNLKCPMCSRNSSDTKINLKGHKKCLSLQENIQVLEKFPNLDSISFIGTRAEATLYKDFIQF